MNTANRTMLGWLAACLALNVFIFAAGWNDSQTLPLNPAWKPPGWLIGMVWLGLFAAMGQAHGRLRVRGKALHWGVAAILLACLAYPLYTGGLQSGLTAFYGTLATLALALPVLWGTTRQPDGAVPWLLLPVVLWLCFAGVLIAVTLRLNGIPLCG